MTKKTVTFGFKTVRKKQIILILTYEFVNGNKKMNEFTDVLFKYIQIL